MRIERRQHAAGSRILEGMRRIVPK
jgi:hypothetical protein